MQRRLSVLFQDRRVNKTYTALVAGTVEVDEGEVDLPLITDWPQRPRQKVDLEIGKPALTRWRVLARQPGSGAVQATTRMALSPVTGRSHQLRVHMLAIGHPIVGDPMYASEDVRELARRLLLHASRLSLPHPISGQRIEVCSAAPF